MSNENIQALRSQLKNHRLDGYIIPNNDEFQNEYLPETSKRLEFLTGFTGSAGTAIITSDKKAFFTDGRYVLQAKQQLDKDFEIHNIADMKPEKWLIKNGVKVGFDGWTLSLAQVRGFNPDYIQPISHSQNLVDVIWKNKPAPPLKPAKAHREEYAGETSESKRKRVADTLQADAALITSPDSINWLLNIRGDDIRHTPFCLCYAALSREDASVDLFIDKRKVNFEILSHLGKDVRIHDIHLVTKIGSGKISIDPKKTPYTLYQSLKNNGADIIEAGDPCQLPKAIKNPTEIEGIKHAHKIDGAALTKFLSWIKSQNGVDEISAADKLEELRRENPEYVGPSFDTISGFGSNGAIVHYRATAESKKEIRSNGIYLLDSGGQYEFGTTDVTRTIAIGEPTPEQRHNYTLVLKGHIAIATAKFPRGTTGQQLDSLARQFLWKEGKDYDHGTGHGVGYFLSVHEGPQGISKRYSDVQLEAGMVISNEPGYYKAGEYGIRLENLVLVIDMGNNYLGFETLTRAPFDDALIEWEILTADEIAWIKQYHEQIS